MQIPVYPGCERSLIGTPSPDNSFHGDDGLGDCVIDGVDPVDKDLLQKVHASNALVELARTHPGIVGGGGECGGDGGSSGCGGSGGGGGGGGGGGQQ